MARVFYYCAVGKAFLIGMQGKLEMEGFRNKVKPMRKLRTEEK